MKLKTSLFNKSIIVSDFKRFWWVGVLYAVILFFMLPLQHMLQDLPLMEEWQKQVLLNSLHLSTGGAPYHSYNGINIQAVLICTLPVLLAVMLFSYLHSTKAATMLHSLPLGRRTLLGSHTLSGVTLMSGAVLINGIILIVLVLFTGLGEYYTFINVAEWIGLTLLFNILLFSIAVFVGMFTGNAIAHVVFTYIINVLPYGLYILVAGNIGQLLHGFSTGRLEQGWARVLPLINIASFDFAQFSIVKGLLYIIVSILFIIAAGAVYDRRKLESAGNVVAFEIVQPVFKYGVAVCMVLLGGYITGYMNQSGKAMVIGSYFIFGFIGYWVSQMLLEKTLKVWHAYKGFLIYNLVVILLIIGALADVTGFVNRVPRIEEIESAYYGDYYNGWLITERNAAATSTKNRTYAGCFKEEVNIRAVMSLHRVMIKSTASKDNAGTEYIAYKLKNGRIMVRKYEVDESYAMTLIKPLYESIEYKNNKYPVLKQDAKDIKLIEIGDRRTNKKPLILSDEKTVQSFMDILKTEMINADYKEIKFSGSEAAYVNITDNNENQVFYFLPGSFENVYSWLKDNGSYDSVMLVPEDIDHITVQSVKLTRYGHSGYSYSGTGGSKNLNDKALIKELLENYVSGPDNKTGGTYYQLDFYCQGGALNPNFHGYIRADTPLSEGLQKELSGM